MQLRDKAFANRLAVNQSSTTGLSNSGIGGLTLDRGGRRLADHAVTNGGLLACVRLSSASSVKNVSREGEKSYPGPGRTNTALW